MRKKINPMESVWAIGLMTGTVLDGMIDIALLKSDGDFIEAFGPWAMVPYEKSLCELLEETVVSALEWSFEGPEPDIFCQAEEALTRAQAQAVRQFITDNGFKVSDIAIIGFHGQTVLHQAPVGKQKGKTRQLGDGRLMAELLGIDVAYDFRSVDMNAGGQGAPLSAIYHQALLQKTDLGKEALGKDTAILNLGGVANITWCDAHEGHIIGFDTGPANAPINDWIKKHGLGNMDRDGALAKKGKVDEERLARLLQTAYFDAPFPKSLDRHSFAVTMADGLSVEDGAATLTAFVASTVEKALHLLPHYPRQLIICGGGRHNSALVEAIGKRARITPILAEEFGWRGDAIEAECFAYLALRVQQGLPISFPFTTGVKIPMTGGLIASFNPP